MNKTFEDFNFIKHNSYDVEGIKQYIDSFSEEWFINTSRQDHYYVHKDTNSYFVYSADMQWKAGESLKTQTTSSDTKLLELLEPIIKDLEQMHHGVRGNVLLIKLKARQSIARHNDSGDYLMFSRRNHIPIVTTEDVFFGVGEDKINMKPGECWEVNNSRLHFVDNNSEIDRVHLLIDIMPKKEMEM